MGAVDSFGRAVVRVKVDVRQMKPYAAAGDSLGHDHREHDEDRAHTDAT
jgi:hypothetical protein